MSEYRVNLEVYNGPLDLLLYLIRRDEVDIYDIPVARITEQYLRHVEMIQQLDPDLAGEFLVLAASLLEIKTRMLLPTPPPAEGAEAALAGDPRSELVRQLLEYKAFKDASGDLHEAADQRALRFARAPEPAAGVPEAPRELDLEDVQVWDLLTAFVDLMEAIGHRPTHHEVVYDDTPVELHAEDLLHRLRTDGPLSFPEVFRGRTRSEMVGLFLALLELVRLRRVRAMQERPFGDILVDLSPSPPGPAEGEGTGEPLAEAPAEPARDGETQGQYARQAPAPGETECTDERGEDDPGTRV